MARRPSSRRSGRSRASSKQSASSLPKTSRGARGSRAVSTPEDSDPESENGGGAGRDSRGPRLTTKREQFCRLIAISRYSGVDAYREAFNPPNATQKTISEQASRLRAVPEVDARIVQLQDKLLMEHLQEGKLSLEQHLRELGMLQGLAVELSQIAPAIQAAHYRGKASGLYIEKTQSATSSLEDLVAGTASDPEYDSPPPVKARGRRAPERRGKKAR